MSASRSRPEIRVRFAPSPTGKLHLGGGRTALFNWLFARKNGGIFILRIEDTDQERSKKEFEEEIIEAIRWLGIDWDKGVGKASDTERYRQSERLPEYHRALEKILAEKKAYWCYCAKEDLEAERQAAAAAGRAPRYSGRCRNLSEPPAGKTPQVIRLKVHPDAIVFHDLIRGEMKFDGELMDDFVIAKNLDAPLYNFAVVVDDADMAITHVIRGEEHLSNTPRQILIQQALGLPELEYAHLPLVLNASRGKLSKREADVSLLSYRNRGYLPEAMVNFLILMGWHPSHNQEVFTLDELVAEFDMERVQKAGAVFNEEKLDWLNREHIKKLTTAELDRRLEPFYDDRARSAAPEFRGKVLEVVRERMARLTDFNELAGFFFALPDYGPELLVWKKANAAEAKEVLSRLEVFFKEHSDVNTERLERGLGPYLQHYGKGNVLWPLRVALSGREASPDPYVIASVLGRDEILQRIAEALSKLRL